MWGIFIKDGIFMSIEKRCQLSSRTRLRKCNWGNLHKVWKKGLNSSWNAVLTTEEAEAFYKEHKERPFNDLVKFMTSGPVMVQVLEGEMPFWKIEI